jgi:hypothetical protein
MKTPAYFTEARRSFHAALLKSVLTINTSGVASNADKGSKISIEIARRITDKIGVASQGARLAGQMSGNQFEQVVEEYLKKTFLKLEHLRPGQWKVSRVTGRGNTASVANYEQYAHLAALKEAANKDPQLASALGNEYMISPDVIITRMPEDDTNINKPNKVFVDDYSVQYASLRNRNNSLPILHASISCKWTLRSDRAQNARTEGLNLVRNRKGRLPHIVVVTGEPSPARIASLALGTGDIDCVYHFALPELAEAVKECLNQEEIEQLLMIMIDGKRLRGISDLPLDLAI